MITIPSIEEIREQFIADYEAELNQMIPSVPKSFVYVWASAWAGLLYLLYVFGFWIYRQISTVLADFEELKNKGLQYDLSPNGAQAAEFSITVPGEELTIVPVGTLWQEGGIVFITKTESTVESGDAVVALQALDEFAGASGNRIIGTEISIVNPIDGLDNSGPVTSIEALGQDEEGLEEFRARVLTRIRTPPQGGAVPDWLLWTFETPSVNVVKAIAIRSAPGEIEVYPLVGTGVDDRLPDSTQLDAITDYISDPVRRPLNCETATAQLFSETTFNVEYSSINPDVESIKTSIINNTIQYFLDRFPRQYANQVNPKDTISLSDLYTIASQAGASTINISVTILYGPSFTDAYQLDSDEIARPGVIEFV
jgi:uncharacterized phage protein gp47/JayE